MSGQADKLSGKVKKTAGDLTNDDSLKAEGHADEKKGSIKEKFSDAVDTVSDKLKGHKH